MNGTINTAAVIILIALMSLSALALEEIPRVGGENHFSLGTGFFNEQMTADTTASRGLTNPSQSPLVADLDGDNINEIIVIDSGNIRLYEGSTLTIVDAYGLTSDDELSNVFIYDIDGDNRTEIIVAEAVDEWLHIIEYNVSNFYNQSRFDLSGLDHVAGADMVLGCRAEDDCAIFYADSTTGGGGADDIFAVHFNSSSIGSETSMDTTSWANGVACFPGIRALEIEDYDNDGIDEYIISYAENDNSAQLAVVILAMDVSSSSSTTEVDINEDVSSFSQGLSCTLNDRWFSFTPPLVFDIDGSPSNGMEFVIGIRTDADSYQMRSYESDGDFLDDYPEVIDRDGLIISNVFLMNAFPDTGTVDFCVLGFNDHSVDPAQTELTCASEQTGEVIETNVFTGSQLYNISDVANITKYMAHSAQHSTETTDGSNLQELVSTFGIWSLDYSGATCALGGACDMDLIYEIANTEGAVISVDAERVGRDDLIVLRPTNIHYIDDGFTNTGGAISEYVINPCLDSTWQVNTSVGVQITVTDVDGDNVAARAILYDGDSNEQDSGWSANFSSGTTISFGFIANTTVSTGVLTLLARDTGNPTEEDEITLTFSVSSTGVEFGDCTTATTVTAEEEDADDGILLDESESDNSITTGVNYISAATGLSATLIWLLFMAFLSIGLWQDANRKESAWALGIIALVEVILLIIGALLGFIGTGIIITIVVTSIAVSGLYLRRGATANG